MEITQVENCGDKEMIIFMMNGKKSLASVVAIFRITVSKSPTETTSESRRLCWLIGSETHQSSLVGDTAAGAVHDMMAGHQEHGAIVYGHSVDRRKGEAG